MASMDENEEIHEFFQSFGSIDIIELQQYGPTVCARGAFGEISLAMRQDPQSKRGLHVVAIKKFLYALQPGHEALSPDIFHEICALRHLQPHPHIVELVGMFPRQSNSLALAFAYCPSDLNLSLEWRRQTRKPLLSMSVIRRVMLDVVTALEYCHEIKGIIHRDVKPGNLLIASNGYVQLCDFGLARPWNRTLSSSDQKETALCTLYYRPPEVLNGNVPTSHVDPSLDVYAAGLILVELLMGRALFPGNNELDQLSRIYQVLGTPEKQGPDTLHFAPTAKRSWREIVPRCTESQHLEDLLDSTITLDPQKRSSCSTLLEHPWFAGPQLVTRAQLYQELVPEALEEPILLTTVANSDEIENSVAIRQVVALAAARKNFLVAGEKWGRGN